MSEPSRIVIHDGVYVYKRPNVSHFIPYIWDLDDLKLHDYEHKKEDYECLYKTFKELDIYEKATREERNYLAPPMKVIYDNKNVPVIVYPYIQPFSEITKVRNAEIDEAFSLITSTLIEKGLSDEQVNVVIEKVGEICEKYDLNIDAILGKLDNCGYNDRLGFRILDYGFEEE